MTAISIGIAVQFHPLRIVMKKKFDRNHRMVWFVHLVVGIGTIQVDECVCENRIQNQPVLRASRFIRKWLEEGEDLQLVSFSRGAFFCLPICKQAFRPALHCGRDQPTERFLQAWVSDPINASFLARDLH